MHSPLHSPTPPQLHTLPSSLPLEGAIRIELQEGIPIFCASNHVQNRIEELLDKQKETSLNAEEERELDAYEEIDDYLSFVNRTLRNAFFNGNQVNFS